MTTPSTVIADRAPRPLFATLPNEILHRIFEEARLLNNEPMTGGISKVFLPFTRQNYFHTITLDSQATFEKFMAALVHRPSFFATHPLSLIESFSVLIGEHETEDGRWTSEYLTPLFRGLKMVRDITLSNSSDLIFTFLSPDIASSLDLARLESLRLDMVCGAFTEVWVYPCYAALHHHDRLKTLHVHYLDRGDSEYYSRSDPPATPYHDYHDVHLPPCPSIKEITWSGWWGICDFGGLSDFLTNFPGLKKLTIEDSANITSFSDEFKEELPGLEDLVLRRDHEFETVDDNYLDSFTSLVPKFPNIISLTISNHILLHGDDDDVDEEDYLEDFYALRGLQHLEKLTLDDSCFDAFTPAAFRILLKPRTRPPRLRELEVNIFPGSVGVNNIEEVMNAGSEHRWELAGWCQNFDYQDAQALLSDAELAGIEISGSIHEAINHHWAIARAMRRVRAMQ